VRSTSTAARRCPIACDAVSHCCKASSLSALAVQDSDMLCCAVLCLQVGTQSPSKAALWVICRQHPGEPMAEWFAEGLLERLTAAAQDSEVTQLLDSAVLYIVPNMCPDGSVRWAGTGPGELRLPAAHTVYTVCHTVAFWLARCADRSAN
jgi:hypothetical protein